MLDRFLITSKAKYLANLRRSTYTNQEKKNAWENANTDDESSGFSFNYALLKIPPNRVTDGIFLRDGVFDFSVHPYPKEIDVSLLDFAKPAEFDSADDGKVDLNIYCL